MSWCAHVSLDCPDGVHLALEATSDADVCAQTRAGIIVSPSRRRCGASLVSLMTESNLNNSEVGYTIGTAGAIIHTATISD